MSAREKKYLGRKIVKTDKGRYAVDSADGPSYRTESGARDYIRFARRVARAKDGE